MFLLEIALIRPDPHFLLIVPILSALLQIPYIVMIGIPAIREISVKLIPSFLRHKISPFFSSSSIVYIKAYFYGVSMLHFGGKLILRFFFA